MESAPAERTGALRAVRGGRPAWVRVGAHLSGGELPLVVLDVAVRVAAVHAIVVVEAASIPAGGGLGVAAHVPNVAGHVEVGCGLDDSDGFRGQKNRSQNRDNRVDGQQLDQREATDTAQADHLFHLGGRPVHHSPLGFFPSFNSRTPGLLRFQRASAVSRRMASPTAIRRSRRLPGSALKSREYLSPIVNCRWK